MLQDRRSVEVVQHARGGRQDGGRESGAQVDDRLDQLQRRSAQEISSALSHFADSEGHVVHQRKPSSRRFPHLNHQKNVANDDEEDLEEARTAEDDHVSHPNQVVGRKAAGEVITRGAIVNVRRIDDPREEREEEDDDCEASCGRDGQTSHAERVAHGREAITCRQEKNVRDAAGSDGIEAVERLASGGAHLIEVPDSCFAKEEVETIGWELVESRQHEADDLRKSQAHEEEVLALNRFSHHPSENANGHDIRRYPDESKEGKDKGCEPKIDVQNDASSRGHMLTSSHDDAHVARVKNSRIVHFGVHL